MDTPLRLQIEMDLPADADTDTVRRVLQRAIQQLEGRHEEWPDGCWDDLRDPALIDEVRGFWQVAPLR